MNHWSTSSVAFLRSVVPEIASVPLYLLRNDESACEWSPAWQACFSQLGDLQAQSTLESRGLWSGRGVCIRVRDDFETWSPRCQSGTLLHELSHGLEFLSQPDALKTELSPVCREWLQTGESKMLADAGIERNDLIRGQHGQNFVRFAMHLYWRARQQVVLSPADLQFLHGVYSLPESKYEAVVDSLSSELAMSRHLNLLRLREPPAAFTELFA